MDQQKVKIYVFAKPGTVERFAIPGISKDKATEAAQKLDARFIHAGTIEGPGAGILYTDSEIYLPVKEENQ
jgi:hypothetical protein